MVFVAEEKGDFGGGEKHLTLSRTRRLNDCIYIASYMGSVLRWLVLAERILGRLCVTGLSEF